MGNVTLDVPDDVLVKLKSGGVEPATAVRPAAAFSISRLGELSTSQAARAWPGWRTQIFSRRLPKRSSSHSR
jgi:hypothetical protein